MHPRLLLVSQQYDYKDLQLATHLHCASDYVSRGSSTGCLKIMSQDELHVHVLTIKTSTDIMDKENLILFLHLRNFRVQLQGK